MLQNSASIDLRVRRTRKLLRDALVVLIEEKGFDALKVSDIANRAMINRVTFYRHYRDKYDLLEHCMDDVFEELKAQTKPPNLTHSSERMQTPLTNLLMLFEHVKENADFYRVMLGRAGAGAFVVRLRQYFESEIEKRWHVLQPEADTPPLPPNLNICFLASAYIGAIVWWLEQGCSPSPAQMASYVLSLTLKGSYHAFGLNL